MKPVRAPSLERRLRTIALPMLGLGVLALGYVAFSNEPVKNMALSVKQTVVEAAYNRVGNNFSQLRSLYHR